MVTAHYVGELMNGQDFDSSVDKGRPITFQVGQRRVIPGWDIGFMDMKKGGKRILIVPPQLAYGARGARDPRTGDDGSSRSSSVISPRRSGRLLGDSTSAP